MQYHTFLCIFTFVHSSSLSEAMRLIFFLTLLSVFCGTLGFFWERSSCSNDRQVKMLFWIPVKIEFLHPQCPSIQRRGCPGCFLGFIGIPRTVETFRGRCINYDHGPLCSLFGGEASQEAKRGVIEIFCRRQRMQDQEMSRMLWKCRLSFWSELCKKCVLSTFATATNSGMMNEEDFSKRFSI